MSQSDEYLCSVLIIQGFALQATILNNLKKSDIGCKNNNYSSAANINSFSVFFMNICISCFVLSTLYLGSWQIYRTCCLSSVYYAPSKEYRHINKHLLLLLYACIPSTFPSDELWIMNTNLCPAEPSHADSPNGGSGLRGLSQTQSAAHPAECRWPGGRQQWRWQDLHRLWSTRYGNEFSLFFINVIF